MTTKYEFLLDKRVVQRNLARGLLDASAVEQAIASLPDRADNATTTSYDMPSEPVESKTDAAPSSDDA